MINIDITLVYQVIGFFILLVILNRLLYKPVQALLAEREERIAGTLEKAAKSGTDVEQGLADYEKRLKEAAVKGHEQRNKLKQQGLEREKEILDAARVEASKELNTMRGELAESKKSALASLREEAGNISKEIAEKILERKVVITAFAFILPLMPLIAQAAEEAHHEGGGGMGWKIFNFILLVIGILLAWFKGIKPMLENRSTDIRKAIEEARQAKDAADKKALEYREKLSLLEKKIAEIQNELKLEGEAEAERIVKDAEAAAVRIAEQARLTADQELKKAKVELRHEVAGLAVQMAEEILGKELNPDDQKRLVKGYIDNLRLN